MTLVANIDDERTRKIRQANDLFRNTMLEVFGKVTWTEKVSALSHEKRQELIGHVRGYTDFNPDNDPHGEHDFGSIQFEGEKWFWKIDYYERGSEWTWGSEDPSDPTKTIRLLTIMNSSEY